MKLPPQSSLEGATGGVIFYLFIYLCILCVWCWGSSQGLPVPGPCSTTDLYPSPKVLKLKQRKHTELGGEAEMHILSGRILLEKALALMIPTMGFWNRSD